MLKYELKKVFARTSNRMALLLLLAVMVVTCYFAMSVSWVDGNGDTHRGPAAVAQLKTAQKEWAGYLDEEAIRRVIAENQRINSMPEGELVQLDTANARDNVLLDVVVTVFSLSKVL